MPGVLDSTLGTFGLPARDIGKMAFLPDDLSSIMPFTSVDEFASKLAAEVDMLSPPASSTSSPSRDSPDSETELLADFEAPVDLLYLLDGNDSFSFPGLSSTFCDGDCNSAKQSDRNAMKDTGRKDPFMGHRDYFEISGVDSLLGQLNRNTMDDHSHEQPSPQASFSAWGHAPCTDDDEPILFSGSTASSSSILNSSSFSDHDTLPDTPTSYSGTMTGDDSDVDIETIPDSPKSELLGYSSSDLSPSSSPTPLQCHSDNKISILQQCSSHSGSYHSSKSSHRFSHGLSSSQSLEENLLYGRSITGKKRKHKDKYSRSNSGYSNVHGHYTTSYCSTGNTVNFHDYAMSPSSCMSTDTAEPTVLSSSSKRVYKRKQQLPTCDISDKDKQNHHNQLERNRRQKLADLFIDLRDEVPNICQQSKASKVMILNQATTYIGELNRLHRSQEDALQKELQRKDYLKRQLRQLEAQLS